MAPNEYFKRQVFVSVQPYEPGVKYVIDSTGTDRKRIGSRTRLTILLIGAVTAAYEAFPFR